MSQAALIDQPVESGADAGSSQTGSVETDHRTVTWAPPAEIAARGHVVVLTGRGETTDTYARFGRRLALDGYLASVLETDFTDPAVTTASTQIAIDSHRSGGPTVLIGADAGALLACRFAAELSADAVVLAGLIAPGHSNHRVFSWEAELAARTACPSHRNALTNDRRFARGEVSRPLPQSLVDAELSHPQVPILVIHGSADPFTPPEAAFGPFFANQLTRSLLVCDGRHDILNDLSHRSVAASVVLFLESLRLGSWLPTIVQSIELN